MNEVVACVLCWLILLGAVLCLAETLIEQNRIERISRELKEEKHDKR